MARRKPEKKAFPTRYGGVNFRSRLEARIAGFLDTLRWNWIYEPDLQVGPVIPDFLLSEFSIPTVLECKPAASTIEIAEARTLMIGRMAPWLSHGVDREILKLDADPEADLALTDLALDDLVQISIGENPRGCSRRVLVIGPSLYRHHSDDGAVTIDGTHGFTLCTNGVDADHVGLASALGERCLHCAWPATAWMPGDMMRAEWAKAGNLVQWRPVNPA